MRATNQLTSLFAHEDDVFSLLKKLTDLRVTLIMANYICVVKSMSYKKVVNLLMKKQKVKVVFVIKLEFFTFF